MYTHPNTAEQCLHNVLKVVAAVRFIGLDYDIQVGKLRQTFERASGWADGGTDERTKEKAEGGTVRRTNELESGRKDGQTNERVRERTEGQLDERTS